MRLQRSALVAVALVLDAVIPSREAAPDSHFSRIVYNVASLNPRSKSRHL
jgi:hypothetical protein